MAHVWAAETDTRTDVGVLIAAAKDHDDSGAAHELGERLVRFVASADVSPGTVVPVPAHRVPPVPVPAVLAAALAAAPWFVPGAELLERRAPGPRVRDQPLTDRQSTVVAAEYHVVGDVVGATIVLVDDVVLTGTTLEHLARLLRDAGAARVEAVVAARSRRNG